MSGPPRPLWTSEVAAAAVGGEALRDWVAAGVSIDSRTLEPGDLFVALTGPSHDGHDFVRAAFERGAAAAIVAREPEGVRAGAPLLRVADTMTALNALGRAARSRLRGRIGAVTGSLGKTGVKEALRHALGRQGRVFANVGSLNNHWGVPLSLARTPQESDFAIFEIGMNHPGEITPLTRLVRPHVAAITTIEAVHIGHFPSVEAIADAKAEIFLGVEPGGTAVLNRDNPHYRRLASAAAGAGVGHIVPFGCDPEAGIRLIEARADADGTDVRVAVGGEALAFRIAAPGPHWVANSLCVLATVAALGGDAPAAARALADLQVPKGRGQRFLIRTGSGAFTLVDDSYNASPASMAAAFATVAAIPRGPGGRRIAALGDMLELGDAASELHAGLAGPLAAAGFDLVFTAGDLMAHLQAAVPAACRGGHAADAAGLAPLVAAAVRPGDVVVVKGSAGSRMFAVVEVLKALEGRPSAAGGG